MKNPEQEAPPQETGRHTDFKYRKSFKEQADSHEAYKKAAQRLLLVNNWSVYAGTGSAKFTLTNNLGDELHGFAAEGLCFSIELPAPGSSAGDGLEWVMVEQIITEGSNKTAEEYVLMTVRPVPDPRKANTETAHFFSEVSTSTFIVKRNGKTVTAEALGRNETPNNSGVNIHDKIRNTVIALAARIGLSGPQWKKLVEGLIEYNEDENSNL
jgi:hypothetical protein